MRYNDCRVSISRLSIDLIKARWWFSSLDLGDLCIIQLFIKQLLHTLDKPFVSKEDLAVQPTPYILATDTFLYKTLIGFTGSSLVPAKKYQASPRWSAILLSVQDLSSPGNCSKAGPSDHQPHFNTVKHGWVSGASD
jgi:hypothetical protein